METLDMTSKTDFINIEDTKFTIVVPPKCGSTAIYTSVYNFENNVNLNTPEIVNIEDVDYIHGNVGYVTHINPRNPILIAIHRDPVERFISGYRHWILDLKQPCSYSRWEKCKVTCFDSFMDSLAYEIKKHPSSAITHHFEPQSNVFQKLKYHYTLPMDKMYRLESIIKGFKIVYDVNSINSNDKEGRPKFSPSKRQIERIKEFYKEDYNNGWDGITCKIPI